MIMVVGLVAGCADKERERAPQVESVAMACKKIVAFDDKQTEKCSNLSTAEDRVFACDQISNLSAEGKLACIGLSQAAPVTAQAIHICAADAHPLDKSFTLDGFKECLQVVASRRPDLVNACLTSMTTDPTRLNCIENATTGTAATQLTECQKPLRYVNGGYQCSGFCIKGAYDGFSQATFSENQAIQCLKSGQSIDYYQGCFVRIPSQTLAQNSRKTELEQVREIFDRVLKCE